MEKTAIEREKRTDKGHFDKEDYVKPIFLVILPDIFFERYRDSTSISLKFLSDDDEMRRKMVSEHSDRTKFFHRMLETLKKVHLISSSYINARTARIDAMDEKITEALKKLYATADNLQSNIEKVCDERSPFKDKIQAFDKLRTEDTSKGKRKYSKKETDNSVVYEILDKKRGKSITKFELGKVDIHTIDKSIKKEIEENFEKLVVSVRNAKHDPSNKFDFDKDYDRGYNEALFLNGEHLILENSKDIENKFAPNDADILRGFCQQGLYEALLRKIAVCIFGEEKRKFEIFTDSRGRLSRIEYSMEYDTSKSTEEAYNKLKDNAENNPLDDKTEVVKSVQANAVIGVENGIVTLNYFDCTFERF
ncbi:hypothetical protein OA90_26670 [Labrenzia sp. OB1]|nr:hypothetical protein OA90_26670 [Labrenzia sp. OB1]